MRKTIRCGCWWAMRIILRYAIHAETRRRRQRLVGTISNGVFHRCAAHLSHLKFAVDWRWVAASINLSLEDAPAFARHILMRYWEMMLLRHGRDHDARDICDILTRWLTKSYRRKWWSIKASNPQPALMLLPLPAIHVIISLIDGPSSSAAISIWNTGILRCLPGEVARHAFASKRGKAYCRGMFYRNTKCKAMMSYLCRRIRSTASPLCYLSLIFISAFISKAVAIIYFIAFASVSGRHENDKIIW